MNLCPTTPVAPRIPIGSLLFIRVIRNSITLGDQLPGVGTDTNSTKGRGGKEERERASFAARQPARTPGGTGLDLPPGGDGGSRADRRVFFPKEPGETDGDALSIYLSLSIPNPDPGPGPADPLEIDLYFVLQSIRTGSGSCPIRNLLWFGRSPSASG